MSNNNKDVLVSEAARPGLWLKERFTPSAWLRMVSEKMVPEYEDRMEAIREFDEDVEERIDKIDSFLNRLLSIRKVKKTLSAAKLAEVAILLNEINAALRYPNQRRQQLLGNLGALTEDDLLEFEGAIEIDPSFLEEHHGEFHEEIRGGREKKSEAGFFGDLIRSLVSWKLQTPEMIKRDKALRKVIDQANTAVKKFKAERSNMASARAKGDIGAYIGSLDKIDKIHKTFQDGRDGAGGYRAIYEKYLFAPMEMALGQRRERGEESPEILDRKSLEEVVEEELGKMPEREEEEAPDVERPAEEGEMPPMPTGEEPSKPTEEKPHEVPLEDISVETPEGTYPAFPGRPDYRLDQPKGIHYTQPPQDIGGEPIITPEPEYPQLTAPTHREITPGPQWSEMFPETGPTEMLEGPVAAHKRQERERSQARRDQAKQQAAEANMSELETAMLKMGHAKFMDELNKVAATGNTGLMVAMLAKYSEMIEEKDPEGSMKLLAIAEGILNG